MDPVTRRARELYDAFPVGDFGPHIHRMRQRNSPIFDEFLARYRPGATLYDVGCGTGYWMDTYVARGIPRDRITGVDLAPSNVARLEARGFRAVCGDLHDLPLPDDVSDFTVCLGVLHHLADPEQGFRELVRITRPNGLIYLAVYNRWNPYFYLVHRATFPLRFAYWHLTPRVLDVVLPVVKAVTQPVLRRIFGKPLDDQTGRVLFMDQVITPRAHLFTRRSVAALARRHGCGVRRLGYNRNFFMVVAILEVLADTGGGEEG